MNSYSSNYNEDDSSEYEAILVEHPSDHATQVVETRNNQIVKQAPVTDSDAVPAGNYLAVITDASHTTHKTGNYPMVTLQLKVSAGEYKDLPLTKYFHLKGAKAVDYFKKEMLSIGFIIERPGQLVSLCVSLPGTSVMANVIFNDSGNRVIYLKSAALAKKVPTVDAAALW